MSDDVKPSGPGPGKIALIVIAILVGLVVVCCGGAWFLGANKAWPFIRGQMALQSAAETAVGPGCTFMVMPSDDDDFVLLAGVPELDPAKVPEIQDAAWKAYCEAFRDGGLGVARVAVGVLGKGATGKGGVSGWKDHAAPAADVAARTGIAPPAEAEWLQEVRASAKEGGDGTRLKIELGGGGDDGEKK